MKLILANFEKGTGYAWKFIGELWKIIGEGGQARIIYPDGEQNILYLTDQPYFSKDYLFWRKLGFKVVIHMHVPGNNHPPAWPKRWLKKLLFRTPLSADFYIACTDYVNQRFIQLGIPAHKRTVVPNGIELQRLNPALRSKYRAEFGIPEDVLLVCSCSRSQKYKGIDTIIRIAREVPHIWFIHIGDGPDQEEFKRQAEGLNFIFTGQRDDCRDIMQACDIGITASHGEVGYSLSTLEMMNAGLPMVAIAIESVTQCIEHGVNGFTFATVDYAAACFEWLEKPKLRAEMSREAKKTAEQYSIERTFSKMRELF